MKIFKYEIMPVGTTNLTLPVGAKILSVQNQNEKLVFWAEVDPSARAGTRRILCVVTGSELTEGGEYLGTTQFDDGSFVTHIYDLGELSAELGVDGDSGFAILGDYPTGEAEFETITTTPEAACQVAFEKLKLRLNLPNLGTHCGPLHPRYYDERF